MFFCDKIIFENNSGHICLELQNLITYTINYKIHKNFESLIPILLFYFLIISHLH